MRILIAILLLLSALFFGLGITLPVVHMEKFYFLEETPSIISLIHTLWIEGSWIIALAVLAFSIVFPAIKLVIVFVTAIAPNALLAHSPVIKWAGLLSKWSMMDVLLVALVIAAAKTSGMANAFVQPGLWFYAVSAMAGAVAAALLKRQDAQSKN